MRRYFLHILALAVSTAALAQSGATLRGQAVEERGGVLVPYASVRTRSSENPAHPIIRSVIRSRRKNNPSNISAYRAQVYRKTLGQLRNIDSAWVEANPVLRSLKRSMVEQNDSAVRYAIPLMFSEEIKEEVFSRRPRLSYSIPQVSNHEGLSVLEQASFFLDYAEIFSREVNFYDDNFIINGTPMVSPISPLAFAYYRFRLHPDAVYDTESGLRLYRIRFLPKNPRNAAFYGEMTVYDSIFALKDISAKLSPAANVPFVIRYDAKVSYLLLRDSSRLAPFKESCYLDAEYNYRKYKDDKERTTASMLLYSHYSGVQLNPPLREMLEDEKMLNEAKKVSDREMRQLRKGKLSSAERDAMAALTELNRIRWVTFADKAVIVLGSGYYSVGKFDIGPYSEMLKRNGAEGLRVNLPLRTGNAFHPNFFADGMAGYGAKDEKAKGMLNMGWKLNTRLRRAVKVGGEYDSFRVGSNDAHYALLKENNMSVSEDKLWYSLFAASLDNKYSTRYGGYVGYEREWRYWLSSTFSYSSYNIEASRYTPFAHNNLTVNVFNQQELSLRFRISSNSEQRFDFFARPVYLSNGNLPVVSPVLTVGSYDLRGARYDGYYAKLHIAVKQDIALGTTLLRYALEGGAILGAVPFPLLEGHRSVESFAFADYKFNLLYNLTLASDRYASLMLEYNLNGLLLNKIPLVRRLKLKEMLNLKMLYSFLNAERHSKVLEVPDYIYARNSAIPYMEMYAGVQNIFHVLGVGCAWRIPVGEKKPPPSSYTYTSFSVVMKITFGG